jgi:phage replication O-like protein O
MSDRDFDPTKGGWFKIMNEFVDAMRVYRLSTTEWAIVMHIIRRTWGDRGQAWKVIPWTEFMKKCEMSKAAVSRATNRLLERNFVHTKKVKNKTAYKINSKPSSWKPPDPHKPPRKNVPVLEPAESVPVLEQTMFQNCNQNVPVLEPYEVFTFKRKDNIKDNGKDTPHGPPAGNGEVGSKKRKAAMIEEQAKEVIDFLNFLSGKTFKHSDSSLEFPRARLSEGYTLDQLKYVCQIKWDDPDHAEKYYRPSTLFRPRNFESYLNEKGTKQKTTKQKARMKDTMELFARRHHERQNPTGGR